jgi:hypothetical protein
VLFCYSSASCARALPLRPWESPGKYSCDREPISNPQSSTLVNGPFSYFPPLRAPRVFVCVDVGLPRFFPGLTGCGTLWAPRRGLEPNKHLHQKESQYLIPIPETETCGGTGGQIPAFLLGPSPCAVDAPHTTCGLFLHLHAPFAPLLCFTEEEL